MILFHIIIHNKKRCSIHQPHRIFVLHCLHFVRIALHGLLIFHQNQLLQCCPGIRIDRMGNVLVLAVCSLTARHSDKQTLVPLNYLDIMYHKDIIDRNRYNGFHLTVSGNLTDSNICNIHTLIPLYIAHA